MQKNQKAAEALNEKQEDVLRMLKEITAAVKNYGKGELVDWGYVGSMAHVQEELKNIHQFINA